MTNNLFCNSCRHLLSGTLPVIDHYLQWVSFLHHDGLDSLEKALHLPCTICNMAYGYASDSRIIPYSPRQIVEYSMNTNHRYLKFKPNGRRELMLVPDAGENDAAMWN